MAAGATALGRTCVYACVCVSAQLCLGDRAPDYLVCLRVHTCVCVWGEGARGFGARKQYCCLMACCLLCVVRVLLVTACMCLVSGFMPACLGSL